MCPGGKLPLFGLGLQAARDLARLFRLVLDLKRDLLAVTPVDLALIDAGLTVILELAESLVVECLFGDLLLEQGQKIVILGWHGQLGHPQFALLALYDLGVDNSVRRQRDPEQLAAGRRRKRCQLKQALLDLAGIQALIRRDALVDYDLALLGRGLNICDIYIGQCNNFKLLCHWDIPPCLPLLYPIFRRLSPYFRN